MNTMIAQVISGKRTKQLIGFSSATELKLDAGYPKRPISECYNDLGDNLDCSEMSILMP